MWLIAWFCASVWLYNHHTNVHCSNNLNKALDSELYIIHFPNVRSLYTDYYTHRQLLNLLTQPFHSFFVLFVCLFVSIFSWIWILPASQTINHFLRCLIWLYLYVQSRQGRTGNYVEDTDIYWTTWQMDYVIKQKIRFVWMCCTLWWGWWGFDGAM